MLGWMSGYTLRDKILIEDIIKGSGVANIEKKTRYQQNDKEDIKLEFKKLKKGEQDRR